MLDQINVDRRISRDEYRSLRESLDLRLGELQRRAQALGVPLIVVFQGWGAAGKGTQINELILPLDPRGFTVYTTKAPSEEEAMRPFLWRFWRNVPARGRWAIFDRSWYTRVLVDRFNGELDPADAERAFRDIRSFERQLADDGMVIVKLFLHISQKDQRRRQKRLRENPATSWRVSDYDAEQNRRYAEYLALADEAITETDVDHAPWTVVEATDRRFAGVKVGETVAAALERGIARAEARLADPPVVRADLNLPLDLTTTMLDGVDLNLSIQEEDYRARLEPLQKRIHELGHQIYRHRVPVVVVYQGWDAAGKGGNIRRLVRTLDPRGYEVVPVSAPNDLEKAHHYLWRFWRKMPKSGHIAIFDRSWYGRVLVERIEGFCSEAEWRRAYREINQMEQHLVHFGVVLLKFWLHIDRDEQLRRFEAREQNPAKRWKIGPEDWRNRDKWDQYTVAVEEMLYRTSTVLAPWTVVPSNSKRYARIHVLETVCAAIEQRLDQD
ncbi:MAG: polyphosphate:AMP phosphotransferase [Candidatus Krumholzibacteriia bacterium]